MFLSNNKYFYPFLVISIIVIAFSLIVYYRSPIIITNTISDDISQDQESFSDYFTFKIYNETEDPITPGIYSIDNEITTDEDNWTINKKSFRIYKAKIKDDIPLKIWLRYGKTTTPGSNKYIMGYCSTDNKSDKCLKESIENLTTIIAIRNNNILKVYIDNSNGYDMKYKTIVMKTDKKYEDRFIQSTGNLETSNIFNYDNALIYSRAYDQNKKDDKACPPENIVYDDKTHEMGQHINNFFDLSNNKNKYSLDNKNVINYVEVNVGGITYFVNNILLLNNLIRKKVTRFAPYYSLGAEIMGAGISRIFYINAVTDNVLTPSQKNDLFETDNNYIFICNIDENKSFVSSSFVPYITNNSACYINDPSKKNCIPIGCRSTCNSLKNNWIAQYINYNMAPEININKLWVDRFVNTNKNGELNVTPIKKCTIRYGKDSYNNLFCRDTAAVYNDNIIEKINTDETSDANVQKTMKNLYCCENQNQSDFKYESDYNPYGFDSFIDCSKISDTTEKNNCLKKSQNKCPIIISGGKNIHNVMKNSLNNNHVLDGVDTTTKNTKNWFFSNDFIPEEINLDELEILYI